MKHRLALVLCGVVSLPLASCKEDPKPGGDASVGGSGGAGGTGGGTGGTGGRGGTGGGGTGGGGSGGGGTGGGGGGAGGGGTGGGGPGGGGTGGGGTGGGGAGGTAGRDGGGTEAGGGGDMGRAEGGTAGDGGGAAHPMMTFFVTSATSTTGNLGGLMAADARCVALATAVGAGAKKWRAYLSVDMGPGGMPVNAKDRIGDGPWHNSKGVMLAMNSAALHARNGDPELFLDEKGNKVNGQWEGSPGPNQHDILTGTKADGTLAAGLTCNNWTGTAGMSQVGHSDGMGPGRSTMSPYNIWNGSHEGFCNDTAMRGGGGKFYCFVDPRP